MKTMRSSWSRLLFVLLIALAAPGCAIAGGIFKAGMWVGILIVVLVLVVIMWIVGKARR